MKVLYPNDKTSSISASSENSSYPIVNVQDTNTQKIWKATGNTATVTLGVDAGATALVIFNTNATTITVTTRSSLGINWQTSLATFGIDWQPALATFGLDWTVAETAITVTYDISASDIGQLWADFATYDSGFVIDILFTAAAGTIIQAGIIQAGIPKVYKDPKYGIQEGFKDYSIVKELNSGGFYVRKRTVARTFSFQLLEDRDVDFYEFMYQIVQVVGPGPLAFRIVHKENTDWEWIVYALFNPDLPQGSHDHLNDSFLDIQLIESL